MSYSAHRDGRMGSDGRISFETDGQNGPADDDIDFLRDYEPTGSESTGSEPTASDFSAAHEPETEELADLERAQGTFGPSRMKRTKPKRAKKPRTPGSRLRTMAILGGADGEVLDRVP